MSTGKRKAKVAKWAQASIDLQADALSVSGDLLDWNPEDSPGESKVGSWDHLGLNVIQRRVFDDPTPNLLVYGERGSGKSCGVLHKVVRHCWEESDALVLIIARVARAGRWGSAEDLEKDILPIWEREYGVSSKPPRLDPVNKDTIIKVGNRHGGWSTILIIAIPHQNVISARLKSIHPSMIVAEELTEAHSDMYYSVPVMQLGRRRSTVGPQQYIGVCNPDGPDHWVYKTFIENVPVEGNPQFRWYHIPFSDNEGGRRSGTVQPDYMQKVMAACRRNPAMHARLVEGKWVRAEPESSLFSGKWHHVVHVMGDRAAGTGIIPHRSFSCVIGYDLGQVYNAAIFQQVLPTPSGEKRIIFDEVVSLKKKVTYGALAAEVIEKILMWNRLVGGNMTWQHIADSSATDQFRPNASGSYDADDFQRMFNTAATVHGIPKMTMAGCPKGPGSVEARVRAVETLLIGNNILVSALCPEVIRMFTFLEEEKDENGLQTGRPKKTASGEIHVFDATSYPILSDILGPSVKDTGVEIERVVR